MSPEMRARITASNEASAKFGEVARDAQMAGAAVKASGENAASGLRAEAAAMQLVHDRTRLVANRTQNLAFQINDLGVQIASGGGVLLPLIQQGSQVLGIYSGQGGVKTALSDVAGLAVRFAPLGIAAGAVAAGFAGLTYEINKTAKTQVNFGDVFMATMQVAAESIGKWFKPAIDQLGAWFGQFIDWLLPAFKTGVNTIINGFTFAYDVIKDTWSLLPATMGDITIQAANNVSQGLADLLNKNRVQITQWLATTGTALGPLLGGAFTGAGLAIGGIGDLKPPKIGNPWEGAASKTAGIVTSDASRDFARDPAGDAFSAISDRAQKLELAARAADKLGKGLKGANDNAKLLAGGLKDVGGVTDLVAESQQKMADTAFGAFGSLTSGLAALFKDNKAFAIANAVVNTAEGITKALAQGGIFGFIGAAGVAAAGAAQIAAIASASPGNASAPSVGGGGAAGDQAAGAAAGPPQSATTIVLHGDVFSADAIERLLAGHIADGSNTLINVIKAAA